MTKIPSILGQQAPSCRNRFSQKAVHLHASVVAGVQETFILLRRSSRPGNKTMYSPVKPRPDIVKYTLNPLAQDRRERNTKETTKYPKPADESEAQLKKQPSRAGIVHSSATEVVPKTLQPAPAEIRVGRTRKNCERKRRTHRRLHYVSVQSGTY